MKFKKTLLITLLLLAVFTISSVSAADNLTDEGVLQDTSSEEIELSEDVNDEVVSSSQEDIIGEPDNGTFTALQNKINNAASGSTITLENDYTYDEGFDTQGIKLPKSMTIDGNGHTINGLSKSRIFSISSDNIILKNINFTNGYISGSGGAIYIPADWYEYHYNPIYLQYRVTVDNCIFSNNNAKNGGAIYCSDQQYVNITNSLFINNNADYSGGAIYAKSGPDIINCNFTKNSAISGSGGAIFWIVYSSWRSSGVEHHDELHVTNCIFTNNKASDDGGAIVAKDEMIVENSKFKNNIAKYGGAIDCIGRNTYSNTSIKNSEFENNKATSRGGAIMATGYVSTIKANNCTFEKNVAEEGSALFNAGPTNCIFKGNKSSDTNLIIGATPINCVFTGDSQSSSDSSSNSTTNSTPTPSGNSSNDSQTTTNTTTNNSQTTTNSTTNNPQTTTSSTSGTSTSKTTKTTPKLIAKKATFKLKTKTKKYKATLKTNKNKAMKKIKLYLKVKGKTYTAKTNNKGKATFNIKNLKKKGTYKATITFKGNKNFKKVTKTVKIIVK